MSRCQWMRFQVIDGVRYNIPVQEGDVLTLTVDLRYFGTPADKLVNKRRSIARAGTEFTVTNPNSMNLGVSLPNGKSLFINPKRRTMRFVRTFEGVSLTAAGEEKK